MKNVRGGGQDKRRSTDKGTDQITMDREAAQRRVEEGLQVMNGAVNDLLGAVVAFVPNGMRKMLEAVGRNLPLVEMADTAEGEKACVDKIAEPFAQWDNYDLARVAIRDCIRELCHYRPEIRSQILAAALQRMVETVANAERLKAMLPAVREALSALEVRALAVSQIMALLDEAGEWINVDFTDEATRPARRKGKIGMDTLRSDPRLSTLLEAYDLADAIRTTMRGGAV